MEPIIEINKTQIGKLALDVDHNSLSQEEQSKVLSKLKKAVQLNASATTRVRLVLKDKTRGLFRIKSKVTMVSDDNVLLRGGILIPIAAVVGRC